LVKFQNWIVEMLCHHVGLGGKFATGKPGPVSASEEEGRRRRRNAGARSHKRPELSHVSHKMRAAAWLLLAIGLYGVFSIDFPSNLGINMNGLKLAYQLCHFVPEMIR
jgi:hypothetical protein